MIPRNIRNRIALARSYLGRRPRLDAFPFGVDIGITNRCNLACAFCPRKGGRRPVGDISLDLLGHLLDQVKPYVDTVDLSFDGEPFLHPRWVECVEACHRHGVRVNLQTNALLLDEPLSREVIAVGVDAISFSLDAATEETYRRIKPGGDYGKAVANVETFLGLARKRPYATLQFLRTPENSREADLFIRRWRGKGADAFRIKPMLNFGGSVVSGTVRERTRPCIILWSLLSIHWDGVVPLCCLDIEGRTEMGDAARQDLKEIIDNRSFTAVRRGQADGRYEELPICRYCDAPSAAWPFVLGSVLVGDLTRRKLVSFAHRLGFLGSGWLQKREMSGRDLSSVREG